MGTPLALPGPGVGLKGHSPPVPSPNGELTWHHGGWVAQGREGHRVPRQLLQLRDLPGRYEETEALGVMAEPPDPPGWALAHTSCPRGHPPGVPAVPQHRGQGQDSPLLERPHRTAPAWRNPGGDDDGCQLGATGGQGTARRPPPPNPKPTRAPPYHPQAPYLVGREQDGAQGEPGVVGDGGPLRRRLEREGRRWRG